MAAAPAWAAPPAVVACPAWPGEPDPLPTIDAADRAEAEWARTRSQELARLARILEVSRPVEAHRFWQHARCLAPDDAELERSARRAVPLNVHRALGAGVASPARSELGEATDVEGALLLAMTAALPGRETAAPPKREPAPTPRPRVVANARAATVPPPVANPRAATLPPPVSAAPPAPPRTDPPALTAAVDRSLSQLASLIEEARFRTALEALPEVRRAVDALPDGDDQRSRAARVELLAGTAQIALGQNDAAREHFRRALRADPSLEMDPNQSRKVRRAFAAAKDAS